MEYKMHTNELIKQTNLNWCIDILKRIDDILKKPNVSVSDLSQVHWLVKQGLKVQKEDE
jgi:hypothetical protein